jgi:hypothetical protein
MERQPALTPAAAKAAMAAGVKTAAIVNYEKYVPRPVTPAPARLEAKPKAKPATKAVAKSTVHPSPVRPSAVRQSSVGQSNARQPAVHHAATKPGLTEKDIPAPNTVVKNAAAKNIVASHPAAPPRVVAATSGAAVTGQKKPSAAIPKETPQN